MARYSAFLGRTVEVQYRAGEILLPASGTFVADSGRSIFLEQHFDQRGQAKQFRWEIPYQYIVRINEPLADASTPAAPSTPSALTTDASPSGDTRANSASAAAGAGGGASAQFSSTTHRTKSV